MSRIFKGAQHLPESGSGTSVSQCPLAKSRHIPELQHVAMTHNGSNQRVEPVLFKYYSCARLINIATPDPFDIGCSLFHRAGIEGRVARKVAVARNDFRLLGNSRNSSEAVRIGRPTRLQFPPCRHIGISHGEGVFACCFWFTATARSWVLLMKLFCVSEKCPQQVINDVFEHSPATSALPPISDVLLSHRKQRSEPSSIFCVAGKTESFFMTLSSSLKRGERLISRRSPRPEARRPAPGPVPRRR